MTSLHRSVQNFVVVGHPCQGFLRLAAYKHVLFVFVGLVRKLPITLFGSESSMLIGVFRLFVATVFLLIGQVEVQAATEKRLEPQGFALASASEAVRSSMKQQPSALKGSSGAPSRGSDSRRQPSSAQADLMAMEWAQLLKVNSSSISIQLKF